MSIDQLVEKSGVPKGTLTKVLTGISPNPALETVKAIAYALGMTLNDLSEEQDPVISKGAARLAMIYDSLTDAGKELLDEMAKFAEKYHKIP
jgi:transcriptional regulator with XRE-family HTH domain